MHNAHRGNTKPLDMGVDTDLLASWLAGYDKDKLTIGVVASHSSLQILHGAKKEGFRTLGIAVGFSVNRPKPHSFIKLSLSTPGMASSIHSCSKNSAETTNSTLLSGQNRFKM